MRKTVLKKFQVKKVGEILNAWEQSAQHAVHLNSLLAPQKFPKRHILQREQKCTLQTDTLREYIKKPINDI